MHHNLTKILSLSNSKGSVSYIIQDLWYSNVCMRWVPWRLTVKYKTTWNVISSSLLAHFRAQRHYPRLLQQMKPELEKKKGNPWNGATFCLPRRKNSKSLCQYARLRSLSSETVKEGFLWMRCQQGKQSSTPTSEHWQNSGSVSNEFGFTTIQQKSCFNIIVQGSTQVQSLGQPLKKLYWAVPNTSTLQPSIWSPAGCDLWYEVWDWWRCELCNEITATWADMALYPYGIHILVPNSWEATGSGQRLCRKIGYRFKPSLFILVFFIWE